MWARFQKLPAIAIFALVFIGFSGLYAGAGALGAAIGNTIVWNPTPSMAMGLYLKHHHEQPSIGSVVTFCAPATAMDNLKTLLPTPIHGPCPGDAPYLLKRVIAVAGDVVHITREGITRNNLPVSHSDTPLYFAHKYHTYPAGTYTVQAPQVWVLSDDPAGFDSRYFGPVTPVVVAAPLFTWH